MTVQKYMLLKIYFYRVYNKFYTYSYDYIITYSRKAFSESNIFFC